MDNVLMQKIVERVRATACELMPEDQWNEYIAKELNYFFCKPSDEPVQREYRSTFHHICREVLTEVAKEKIKIALEKYDSQVWVNGDLAINDELLRLLTENASQIFVGMIGGLMQTVINDMRRERY